MNRKGAGMYAKIALLLAAAVFLFLGRNVYASSRPDSSFEIELEYGFDNTVKLGKNVVFTVTVKSEQEDFTGAVHLVTSAYDDFYYYGSTSSLLVSSGSYRTYYDNYGVSKSLTLSKGGEETIQFLIPVQGSAPYARITLEDEEGEVCAQKDFALTVRNRTGEVLAGILTDYPESMRYLDGAHPENYPGITLSTVILSPDDVGTQTESLDMLDLVIAEESSVDLLDDAQKEALRRWIHEGGALVLDCAGDSDQVIGYGDGRVVYFSQGLYLEEGNVSDGNWMAEKILTQALTAGQLSDFDSNIQDGGQYWTISNELDTISVDHIPAVSEYGVLLLIYIILAGPVLYLVVKRLHVRKYLWGGVGILAVVFSMFIFLMGSRTRFNAPFMDYVRTIFVSPGYSDESVDFSVRAPYNESYSIYVNQDYEILPIGETAYYSSGSELKPDFSRESVHFTEGEEENQIIIEGGKSFTKKFFRATKTTEQKSDQGVTGTICLFDGKLEGTLKNNTGYDLRNVYFFFQNHLFYVEKFSAGESCALEGCVCYDFAPGYGGEVINSCLGYEDDYQKKVTEEFIETDWEARLLQNQVRSGYDQDYNGCRMVGFAEEPALDLMKDSAYQMHGKTLVTADVELTFEKEIEGEMWSYDPFLSNRARVVSGDVNTFDNLSYSGEAIIEYTFQSGLTDLSLVFRDEENYDSEYYREFGGTIELYDYMVGEYEQISKSEELDAEALSPYLSSDGTLTVRYTAGDSYGDKLEMLPHLIAKGRVENAGD